MSATMSDHALSDPATQNFIRRGIERLRDEFRGIFCAETLARFVDEAAASPFRHPPDSIHAGLFVNRFARERLQALAKTQGKVAKDVPEVLFGCVHNAGRSQMAAGLLDRYANGRVHVRRLAAHLQTRETPRSSQRLLESLVQHTLVPGLVRVELWAALGLA